MSHLAAAEEGDRSSVSCTARGEPLCEDFHKCVEKLESLMLKRRKDLFVIREVSKQLETFTSSTRKLVYPVLLGVSDSDTSFVADIAGIDQDLESQRIIASDVNRTRRSLPFFEDSSIQSLMVKLLTFYCKRCGTPYTQGMNEVLAAFINLFVDELSETKSAVDIVLEHQASIFNCFYAFMSRFLCNTFRSDNFCTLKCSLAHFTLLLRFHDPQLAQFLAQFSVDPELFAMSWFLTAFAHGTEIGTVETVWDALIIHDDSTLIYFVAVATIMHFRDRLLNSQIERESDGTKESARDCVFEELLDIKQRVRQDTALPMLSICRRALEMSLQTPRSFHAQIETICCGSYEPTPDDLVELQKHKYVSISPKEFVSQLFRQSRGAPSNTTRANAAKTKYFVLDCRSREQYDNECIVTSLNLPAELLSSGGDECNHVVDSLLAMSEQGCLLCFLDERPNRGLSTESETSESATRPHSVCAPTVTETIDQWISFLSQRGVRRCAVVDGGYIQCKHAAAKLSKNSSQTTSDLFQKRTVATADLSSKKVDATEELRKIGHVFQLGFQSFKEKLEQIGKDINDEMVRSAATGPAPRRATADKLARKRSKEAKKARKKAKAAKKRQEKVASDELEINSNDTIQSKEEVNNQAVVKLSKVITAEGVQLFKAFRYENGTSGTPCFLVLRPYVFQCLIPKGERGDCYVYEEHALVQLQKLTMKKSNADLITFHFTVSSDTEEETTLKLKYVVPERKAECVQETQRLFGEARASVAD